jgi:phage terminase small subunit
MVTKSPERVKPGTSKAAAAERRGRFADAYIRLDGNGTKAAIEAGYSERSAHQQAAFLLKDATVRSLIDSKRAEVKAKTALSRDLVAESARWAIELDVTSILTPDGKYKPVHEWPVEVRKAVQELELDKNGKVLRVKFTSRSTARDQGARMTGAYEKDNRQKAEPLAAMLAAMQGQRSAPAIVQDAD